MKHLYYILVGIMLISLSACEEERDSQLITSTTQVSFPSEGGSQTIEIESNSDWHVVSDVNWLSVYPSSGSMNKTITITTALQDNELEQESKIVVSTNDGRKVVNVSVKVEGTSVKSGKYLKVKGGNMTLGGKAKYVDSITVSSNMTWEVLGPEWIESWDGERWRPLSPTRGIVRGNGIKNVQIRTASDNKSDESLEDVITVREYLTGEFSHTLNVEQLGRLKVDYSPVCFLEDGLAFGWICGCDVSKIYFKVTDNLEEEYTLDYLSSCEVTDESYINSVDLTSGKEHLLICVGEDSQGHFKMIYSKKLIAIEERKSMAEIVTALYMGDGQWNFNIGFNRETYDYLFYATDSPNSVFQYSSPIAWYIVMRNHYKNFRTMQTDGAWVEMKNFSGRTDEIHAMAQAWGVDGNGRWKVFRYDRFYDSDGKRLPAKPLLYRIPKDKLDDTSLLP